MAKKDNITLLKDCYGCGVCSKICPVNIISIVENSQGFYSPIIYDNDECIECGLCLKTCAFNNPDLAINIIEKDIKAYAAWSNDEIVRERCSSGGIGFEIGRYLIENNVKCVGVRYNLDTNRAEHYISDTVVDFAQSIGSKYIPSSFEDALSNIDLKEKYLVCGTPCQIDSFRRLIKLRHVENNFILLDFFCHGVPSLLMWDKYLSSVKNNIGEISFVSWRNKSTGWHDSWSIQADNKIDNDSKRISWHDSYNLLIKEKKHLYASRYTQGDLFYKFFLGNYCLDKCCYESCKYKQLNSSADIRIGDLWGSSYSHDDKGVSAVLAFSETGDEILSSLQPYCTFIPESVQIVTEGQMKANARKPGFYSLVMMSLKSPLSLEQCFRLVVRPIRLLERVVNKIGRLAK